MIIRKPMLQVVIHLRPLVTNNLHHLHRYHPCLFCGLAHCGSHMFLLLHAGMHNHCRCCSVLCNAVVAVMKLLSPELSKEILYASDRSWGNDRRNSRLRAAGWRAPARARHALKIKELCIPLLLSLMGYTWAHNCKSHHNSHFNLVGYCRIVGVEMEQIKPWLKNQSAPAHQ